MTSATSTSNITQNPSETNAENFTKTQDLFLGIVEKKYIRSVYGAMHGIGSLLALILANYVFFARVATSSPQHLETVEVFCHGFNVVSASITMLFFWDKVQNWQLSTTSMKEKGLTPLILKRLNQGRGVVTMLLYSALPLLQVTLPMALLDNAFFSVIIAFLFIGAAIWVYFLVKDYSKPIYLAYGELLWPLGYRSCFPDLSAPWTKTIRSCPNTYAENWLLP